MSDLPALDLTEAATKAEQQAALYAALALTATAEPRRATSYQALADAYGAFAVTLRKKRK